MDGTSKGRTIRESDLFTAQRDKIEPDVRRMDEVLDGIYWGLGENPRQYRNVPGTKLWVAKTDPFPGAPRVRVWFRLGDEIIDLLSIECIEEDE